VAEAQVASGALPSADRPYRRRTSVKATPSRGRRSVGANESDDRDQ